MTFQSETDVTSSEEGITSGAETSTEAHEGTIRETRRPSSVPPGTHRFFRPAPLFTVLEQTVLRTIFERKDAGVPLRVWVPNCSTGEQAYSLAVLLLEHLESHQLQHDLEIFGTDTDEDALVLARKGSYSLDALIELQSDRRARFFNRDGERFRISRRIRDSVVFSVHDLFADPPLSRMDLVWCGGTTVARSTEQAELLFPNLARALLPGGLLALGNSEQVGPPLKLFTSLPGAKRVYQRRATPAGRVISLPKPRDGRLFRSLHEVSRRVRASSGRSEAFLMQKYAPPSAIVDEAAEVLRFVGNTGDFLEPPPGPPTNNLMQLARLEIREHLRRAFHRAVMHREPVTTGDVEFDALEPFRRVRIVITPFVAGNGSPSEFVVAFEERGRHGDTLEMMQWDLKRAREDLARATEEFQFTNEELRSANEELLSTNEELRAANEELDVLTEELRTSAEDGKALVDELSERFSATRAALDHARARFQRLSVPIVILNERFLVEDFTDASGAFFQLIETDRGRPLTDVRSKLNYPDLTDDLRRVALAGVAAARVVESSAGGRYRVQLTPREAEQGIELAVLPVEPSTGDSQDPLAASWSDLRERAISTAPESSREGSGPPSLGNFAAEIAHEIKDPLNTISISAEFALRTDDTEKVHQTLETIRDAAQRCGRIVKSVLGLVRHETSSKWPNDVHVVVRHAAALMQSYMAAGLVEFKWRFARGEALCRCNPTELEQVFVNLFKNAVQATQPRKCTLLVSSQLGDGHVVIVVSDDGPGMPADVAERVFDRLYSTRRSSGGTGLGLPLAREIMTSHHGRIRVLPSTSGTGTAIELTLPLATE